MKYHLDSVGRAAPLGGAAPSPSLVKAALIATADSLTDPSSPDYEGELCPCVDDDCRPSPHYGWGRVNLDRLTNGVDRFYRNEVSFDALETGESRSWTRKVDDSDEDILIVLAWTDEVGSTLKNDLDLTVWGPGNLPPDPPGTPVWYGNTFPENYPDAETGADGWGYSVDLWQNLPPGEGDSVNNVEAVLIYNGGSWPAGSGFQIVVSAAEVVTLEAQDFSVYAYNLRFSQVGQ